MSHLDEPLLESAPIAWRLAPQLCKRDPVSGETCAWYHGFWQILRVMKLVTTPEVDAEFLRGAFEAVRSRGDAARVLICGAADYCVLAHAVAAFREQGRGLRASVVDACETPLNLNRWYASRVSQELDAHHGDVLEHSSDAGYDAVCAHSFLGHIPQEKREALVARWRRLLAPGGLAIVVNRVRPEFAGSLAGFSEAQSNAFREAVASAAEPLRGQLRIDPDELVRAAEAFARRRRPYPTRTTAEIVALLEQGGFAVEQISEASVPISGRGESGPTGSSERVRILARRRDL